MSRIIVKNIPKEITEVQLRDHFNKKGEITDVKIMKDEKEVSRRFAFLGYKNYSEQSARALSEVIISNLPKLLRKI